MAKVARKITAKEATEIDKPGRYRADHGLFLNVSAGGTKSWVFLYQHRGRRREMGFGPFPLITFPRARAAALDAKQKLAAGIDPLEAKAIPAALTFKEAAAQFIGAHESGWHNAKHRAQWKSTLESYAYPVIGMKSVSAVDTADIRKILDPIWSIKTETATRVRQRIESILDWSRVQGFRDGENPARWKGHLEYLLPQPSKLKGKRKHPALPYAQVPSFVSALRGYTSVSAAALGFAILTCARTGEVIGATWDEIDLKGRIWTVPGERMKAEREHRVPLSRPVIAILRFMRRIRVNDHIFPGATAKGGLSNMAMAELLKGMNGDAEPCRWFDPVMKRPAVPHGFRSSFRDWAAETTSFNRDVAEMALAHAIESKVEASYRRGDLFEQRRKLAAAWAGFCGHDAAKCKTSSY